LGESYNNRFDVFSEPFMALSETLHLEDGILRFNTWNPSIDPHYTWAFIDGRLADASYVRYTLDSIHH
jgi:hypothetical protein